MSRGRILAAILGFAGVGMLSLGLGSTSASAQAYSTAYPGCAPGYYYANGYCYPYQPAPPPVIYYPNYPNYFYAPPVVVGPSFGFGFNFGGGFHHDHFRGGDHHHH